MVAALVIIAVAATAIVMLLAHKPSQATASPSATGKGGSASGAAAAPVGQAKAAASGPATFPSPDGAEARWVIQENDKPGTTAWQIHGAHGGISGFASQVYAQPGQQVTLYVSTTGPSFRAGAFRMGYYHGPGAGLIWTSAQQSGKVQPACPVSGGTNMVACDNWSPSLTFTVTQAFVQGDYLIKLTGPGNRQSYVPADDLGPRQRRHVRDQERRVHLAGLELLRRLRLLPGPGQLPRRHVPDLQPGPEIGTGH